MTPETGSRVRSLVDLMDNSGMIVPLGSRGVVIGWEGDRLVVSFDGDPRDGSDERIATCNRWEVRGTS